MNTQKELNKIKKLLDSDIYAAPVSWKLTIYENSFLDLPL